MAQGQRYMLLKTANLWPRVNLKYAPKILKWFGLFSSKADKQWH